MAEDQLNNEPIKNKGGRPKEDIVRVRRPRKPNEDKLAFTLSTFDKLTPLQQQLLPLTIKYPKYADLARATDIPYATLYRVTHTPEFEAAQRQMRRDIYVNVATNAVVHADQAVAFWIKIMNSGGEETKDRLKASDMVYRAAAETIRIDDLYAEVAALKQFVMNGQGQTNNPDLLDHDDDIPDPDEYEG